MVFKGKFFCSRKQPKPEGGDGQNRSSVNNAWSNGNGNSSISGGSSSRNGKKNGALGKEETKKEINGAGVVGKDSKWKKKETSGKDIGNKLKEAADIGSRKDGICNKEDSAKLKKVATVDQTKDKSPGQSPKETVGDRSGIDRSSGAGSPILASSLGLNRIKTRSGPLPQESFGGRGLVNNLDHLRRFVRSLQDGVTAKGSTLGASKLSRTETCSNSTSNYGKSSQKVSSGHGSPMGSGSVTVNDDRGSQGASSRKESQSGTSRDNISCGSWVEIDSNCDSLSSGGRSRDDSPVVHRDFQLPSGSRLQYETKASPWDVPGCSRSSGAHIQETEVACGAAKESESPRFQALLRVTGGPWKKKFPNDVKSFSHELDPRGVRPFPFWKPRNFNNLQEVLTDIRARFDRAKEEVDSDLAIFAGDLVEILEKNAEAHPEWQESLEDLLVLARQCAMMSPGEFWLQCEGIVQDLDDRRQELLMGVLKQLHTRMLFILTRCTRLLQFHKEQGLDEDGNISRYHVPSSGVSYQEKEKTSTTAGKELKQTRTPRFFSEEQKPYNWEGREKFVPPLSTPTRALETDTTKSVGSSGTRDRISSWKKLPSVSDKNQKRNITVKESSSEFKSDSIKTSNKQKTLSDGNHASVKAPELSSLKENSVQSTTSSKHQHRISWGYWGDQQNFTDGNYAMICRICEEEVPTSHLEEHSRLCTIADRCDLKGLSVDERLRRIAETLEKIMESYTPKSSHTTGGSPEVGKACNMSVTEEPEGPSPKLSDSSRRGSEDMLDYLPENYGMDETK
ncbi:hypothetical protein KI387_031311, partial [Taxus chinensis]